MRQINSNPAATRVSDFVAATNSYAEQEIKNGRKAQYIDARNAEGIYKQLMKMSLALVDSAHPKHNEVFNSLKTTFGKNTEQMDGMYAIGQKFLSNVRDLAEAANKRGMAPEKAAEFAFNSVAGNPVFDHFANLNLLAGQLYEEQTFIQAFLESGDAFAVPMEPGGTGSDKTRFRVPVEQVVGSPKIMQGDINPAGSLREDNNTTQVNLYNEFKNAVTIDTVFYITQAQRDAALGFESSVAPALAGFVLQNRYFSAGQQQILKIAESMFVGGIDPNGTYTPGVGGSYGLLSSAVHLALGDAGAAQPVPASGADWLANPTKLIQKVTNFYYKPTDVTAQLAASLDVTLMYKEIVRLFNLAASANVDFGAKVWNLFVPSTWYAFAMQYPSSGTFNKQLQEMVQDAVGGKIIKKINILPSSLLNYDSVSSLGALPYNYMVLIAQGAPQEKKPVIMPGQTAIPTITSENVSANFMKFKAIFPYGGPMVVQYGGCFVLEFSVQA